MLAKPRIETSDVEWVAQRLTARGCSSDARPVTDGAPFGRDAQSRQRGKRYRSRSLNVPRLHATEKTKSGRAFTSQVATAGKFSQFACTYKPQKMSNNRGALGARAKSDQLGRFPSFRRARILRAIAWHLSAAMLAAFTRFT